MADSKLSALTALTGPPAEDDLVLVADVSATASKKMRVDELVKAMTEVARTFTAAQVIQVASGGGTVIALTLKSIVGDGTEIKFDFVEDTNYSEANLRVKANTVGAGGACEVGFDIYEDNGTEYAELRCSTQTGVGMVFPKVATSLKFDQIADLPTAGSNCANIGAEDVAGTAEMIAGDEAGNETQLTPHAPDGPPDLYAEIPGREKVIRSINRFDDRVEFVNLTRLAKAVEILAGEKLTHTETLAEYNARTGRNKTKLDWDAVQAEQQAEYDAKREAQVAHIEAWQAAHPQAKKPQPKLPDKDIRKPKPAWMKG